MSMKLETISSMLTFLSIDSGMTKTIRQTLYQKPKLEEEKITLNMFYLKLLLRVGRGYSLQAVGIIFVNLAHNRHVGQTVHVNYFYLLVEVL